MDIYRPETNTYHSIGNMQFASGMDNHDVSTCRRYFPGKVNGVITYGGQQFPIPDIGIIPEKDEVVAFFQTGKKSPKLVAVGVVERMESLMQ